MPESPCHSCHVGLLVVALEPDIAAWCAKPLEPGVLECAMHRFPVDPRWPPALCCGLEFVACQPPVSGARSRPMKSYVLKEINAVTLPEVAVVRHEPMQPGVWEELARRELGERDRLA